MEAEQVVASLFRVHLGLDDPDNVSTYGAALATTFRDLFGLPALAQFSQKVRLIAAAEQTCCADVIMDVLLFVSQTMAKDAFYNELRKAPLCQQHWIQYELSQQRQDHTTAGNGSSSDEVHRLAVEARVAGILSTLVSTKTNPHQIAIVLLQLIFTNNHDHGHNHSAASLIDSLAVANEVLRVATRIKPYKLPQWTIDLLYEFVELSALQLTTEQRDEFHAPPAQNLASYFDKRARGANTVNANWRMRSFQLQETTLNYSKHDADKLAVSRNPFLDKRVKGSVALSKGMAVQAVNYAGKVSRRPYCIQIGEGENALIMDAATPVTQAQWIAAIAGNIRRLELDPIWLRFPRPSVHGMSLHAFVKYCLLYHSETASASECDPQTLATTFKLNDKRLVFLSLLVLAQRGDWHKFETTALTTSSRSLILFKSSTVSSLTDAGSAIGFGVILDLAVQYHAPLGLIATLEALFAKHEPKKPGWMCHTNSSASPMTPTVVDGVVMGDTAGERERESQSTSSLASAF